VGAGVVTVSGFGATHPADPKASSQQAGFPARDPTRSLAATRITALDRKAGWGGGTNATVFEGLIKTPKNPPAQVAAEWWATVLAVGANVKGGHALGVGIVTSPKNLNEGRPTYRVGSKAWSTGITPAQIKVAIKAAANDQGFRIEQLSVHTTPAGPAAAVIVTPAVSDDAITYLLHHAPFRVSQLQRGAAIFAQVVDSHGLVVYADGEVPNTVTLNWGRPTLRCLFSLTPTGCP
jgi:hypothetical protein